MLAKLLALEELSVASVSLSLCLFVCTLKTTALAHFYPHNAGLAESNGSLPPGL